MRPSHILSCISAVSAFNIFVDLFQRQNTQSNCTVYTIIQYPCAIETWVASNTVLWIDACSTTLNVTNAPTGLTTTITSTTTLGVSTSTTTVSIVLQTTSTLSMTLTLPSLVQSISTTQVPPTTPISPPREVSSTSPTASSTTSIMSPATTNCIHSSTAYPDPLAIPANTTYIIQITSPEIVAQLGSTPVYLTKYGGINNASSLAVEVFFYDGVIYALDSVFGVGWYGTAVTQGDTAFALEQYSSSSQSIARTFTASGTPLQLSWNDCQFGNPNPIWALNVVDGLIYTFFSGNPAPPADVEVTLLLIEVPSATQTLTKPASTPSSTMAAVSQSATCIPPSTTGYAPGNNIPANQTYALQIYHEVTPGVLAPYLDGGDVYLQRNGSYTAGNSFAGAIEAFFVDGTLVAADPIFIYGWFTTTVPAEDAVFALGEYLPQAGLVARNFEWVPTVPPSLGWTNCAFEGGAASFVLNQDNALVYAVFDGNMNQGSSHIPIWLVPTIYA